MGLIDDLGAGPVGLDTPAFIHYIEENPRYLPLVEPVFQALDAGVLEGVTSAITLLEVLVVPYRSGNTPLAERYEALLTRGRGLRLFDLTRPLLRAAARLRATTGLKTPDALQVAAALSAGSTTFVTNDDRWPEEVAGLRIAQLEGYLG
ncbi:MAG TPA: PIN domain-containing protein [Thermoanaerobaculia bacterium]|nr:PIN domain-containing protein [Thermoanaerobaculia bacterium]